MGARARARGRTFARFLTYQFSRVTDALLIFVKNSRSLSPTLSPFLPPRSSTPPSPPSRRNEKLLFSFSPRIPNCTQPAEESSSFYVLSRRAESGREWQCHLGLFLRRYPFGSVGSARETRRYEHYPEGRPREMRFPSVSLQIPTSYLAAQRRSFRASRAQTRVSAIGKRPG